LRQLYIAQYTQYNAGAAKIENTNFYLLIGLVMLYAQLIVSTHHFFAVKFLP